MKTKTQILVAIWLFFAIAVVVLLILAAPRHYPQTPNAPLETKPLSPMGALAAQTIHQKINQINADMQAFIKAELDGQHLSEADGWTVNFQVDRLERYKLNPPAATPTPADKDKEKAKPVEPKK